MTHELWANLNAHIFVYLRSVTLAAARARSRTRRGATVLHDHRQPPSAARKPEPAPSGREHRDGMHEP